MEKVILIGGAQDIEIEYFLKVLKDCKVSKICDYEFYEGTINNIRVIISKTFVGLVNATLATSIGIMKFKPDIVINQGIAGAHDKSLKKGDIIIGKSCANINAYKMPLKEKGEGADPFSWEPNKRANDIKFADANLVEIFQNNIENAIVGTLGSGDVFNREYDRIIWINKTFNNLCEDMESIGVYSVCSKFNIPCIGVRIISNNELTKEKLDKSLGIDLQRIIVDILEKVAKNNK